MGIKSYFNKNRFMEDIFCILVLVMLLPLVYYCLTLIGINPDSSFEFVTLEEMPFIWNCAKIVLGLLIILIANYLYDLILYRIPEWLLLTISSIIILTIAISWIIMTQTVPEADQAAVYKYAVAYLKGDRSMLGRGKYMSYYKQNLGLMCIWMLLIKLFGLAPYFQFKLIVAASLPFLVLSGYRITGYLSDNNRRAQFFYLLFILTNFPVYGYVPYMYGDLLSTVLLMCCTWCFMSCLKEFQWYKPLILVFLCSAAIFVRLNSVIVLIAFLAVIVGLMLRNLIKKSFSKKSFIALVLTLLAVIIGIIAPQSGIDISFQLPADAEPSPAMGTIYMGIYEWEYPGWYNGADYGLSQAYDFDAQKTSEAAKEKIKEILDHYRKDPSYCFNYFRYKFASQWETPMYICLPMNRFYTETPPQLVSDIYSRQGIGMHIEKYMKLYQLLLYFFLLAIILYRLFRKQTDLLWYTPFIGIYGGFLFSMIWEAKTRYILPYFILAIPYMAYAAGSIKKPSLK